MKFLLVLLVLVGCSESHQTGTEITGAKIEVDPTTSEVECTLGRVVNNKIDGRYTHLGQTAYYTDENSKPTLTCKGSPSLIIGCIELCEKLLNRKN